MSGKHFGDIVMVSEFIDTFKNFLQTEEDFPLKTGIMSYFNSLLLQGSSPDHTLCYLFLKICNNILFTKLMRDVIILKMLSNADKHK